MPAEQSSAFDEILFWAADLFLVSVENILSKKRERSRIVPARQAVCLVLRRQGLSTPRVARVIGYADHSTVLHSCGQAEARERTDARYRDRIAILTRKCAAAGGDIQHSIPIACREEYRRLRLIRPTNMVLFQERSFTKNTGWPTDIRTATKIWECESD